MEIEREIERTREREKERKKKRVGKRQNTDPIMESEVKKNNYLKIAGSCIK